MRRNSFYFFVLFCILRFKPNSFKFRMIFCCNGLSLIYKKLAQFQSLASLLNRYTNVNVLNNYLKIHQHYHAIVTCYFFLQSFAIIFLNDSLSQVYFKSNKRLNLFAGTFTKISQEKYVWNRFYWQIDLHVFLLLFSYFSVHFPRIQLEFGDNCSNLNLRVFILSVWILFIVICIVCSEHVSIYYCAFGDTKISFWRKWKQILLKYDHLLFTWFLHDFKFSIFICTIK